MSNVYLTNCISYVHLGQCASVQFLIAYMQDSILLQNVHTYNGSKYVIRYRRNDCSGVNTDQKVQAICYMRFK